MSQSVKLNILIAYPYFGERIFEFLKTQDPQKFRLIIDSGAFSAYNSGHDINIDDYIEFLKRIPKEWEIKVVQLDVIGDAQKTLRNLQYMHQKGIKNLMPVFTKGEDFKNLDRLYEYGERIMFGGITFGSGNKNYITKFIKENKGRPAHWLGFVDAPFIKTYKPASVDSSAQQASARFGSIASYCGGGRIATYDRKNLDEKFSANLARIGKSKSIIPRLESDRSWKGNFLENNGKIEKGFGIYISTLSHIKRAIEVEKRLGTQIYMACALTPAVKASFYCFDELMGGK